MVSNVRIVITTTCIPRVGPIVAKIVKAIIEEAADSIESVHADVADFKLPVCDKSVVPCQVLGQAILKLYHDRRCSAKTAKHEEYILVMTDFNYGMASSTKNIFDYLKNEWAGKPALSVSYGITSGKIASALTGGASGVFAAIGEGKLGHESREARKTENKATILKGFNELKESLKNTPKPPSYL